MRKTLLLLLMFAFAPLFLSAQQIQSFDTLLDSTYFRFEKSPAAADSFAFITRSLVTEGANEGAGAMQLDYSAQNSEGYGGFVKIEHILPGAEVFDWSEYDSISFWYNNIVAQNVANSVHVRFQLYDVSDVPDTTSSASDTEFYYSFQYILDDEPGWNEWKMPLVDGRGNPNLDEWGGEADEKAYADL